MIKIFYSLKSNKEKIFLVDMIGAGLSFILTNLIYFYFQDYFGLPKEKLILMIYLILFLMSYSFFWILFIRNRQNFYLRLLALFNFLYSFFTLFLLYQNQKQISLLGFIYFISEVCIILILAWVEFKLSLKE